jgi:crotonobetainyl-CoA:carnitine CoA-transferase CaiB-like acyl-CoA transferase
MSGPLSGIRVVDFSRVLAGPLCARTLQDLGAEVIKVEPPSPDVSRFAFPSTDGMSGYYAQQNAGKRNVSINLNIPGAYDLALKLCDTADVVVENFRAGTLGFFGLDYETLSKRNPRLIYASITGYGQGGPWRSRMAYAPTVQAEAGFTENSVRHYGEALKEPRTDSLSHADVYAGLQAVIAILAALNSRQTTGQGQYIDVARRQPYSRSTNAPMSICPMTTLVQSPRCSAPPIAHSSRGRGASISPSPPALSAAERFRLGCARCGASI